MIVFASFMVLLTQNTGLEQTIIQTRQMDNDVAREQVKIFTTTANPTQFLLDNTPGSTAVRVSCIINNTGTVPIQIIRVWVEDQSTKATGSTAMNTVIQQGQVASPAPIPVAVTISDPAQTVFWFVTARGNKFNQYTNQGPQGATGAQGVMGPNGTTTSAQVAQGIGSIMMNFTDFTYFNITQSGPPSNPISTINFTRPSSGYSVTQGNTGVVFRVKVTNLDQQNRIINLTAPSFLWFLIPVSPTQQRGAPWYLVNVTESGLITNNVPIQTLRLGVDTYLYFSSKTQVTSSAPFEAFKTDYIGAAPVNLALVGTATRTTGEVDYFGQNLPFVSIIIR